MTDVATAPHIGIGTIGALVHFKGVGEALTASSIPREELFLISKVWCDKIYEGPAAVRAQVETTLADLGVEYLDMYLIHW